MLRIISVALVGLSLAGAAQAETTTMSRPMQAGILHDGPRDMVAYWMPLADGSNEVTATFIGRVPGDRPGRVFMEPVEADSATFSPPAYRDVQSSVSRADEAVVLSVEPVRDRLASR